MSMLAILQDEPSTANIPAHTFRTACVWRRTRSRVCRQHIEAHEICAFGHRPTEEGALLSDHVRRMAESRAIVDDGSTALPPRSTTGRSRRTRTVRGAVRR